MVFLNAARESPGGGRAGAEGAGRAPDLDYDGGLPGRAAGAAKVGRASTSACRQVAEPQERPTQTTCREFIPSTRSEKTLAKKKIKYTRVSKSKETLQM